MAALFVTAFVALSLSVATATAVVCESGQLYRHPYNCSGFIVCDRKNLPKLFYCSDGQHFDATQTICDKPEVVKCELENGNTTALAKDILEKLVEITKVVGNQSFKNNNRTQNGQVENNTDKAIPDELIFPLIEVLQNKATNETDKTQSQANGAAKTDVAKQKKKNEDLVGSDIVAHDNTNHQIKRRDEVAVQSEKIKTVEKFISLKNTTNNGFDVKKLVLPSKVKHSISKRQEVEMKKEDTQKRDEKMNKEETPIASKKLFTKMSEEEFVNTSNERNETLNEGFNSKDESLDLSKKLLIDLVPGNIDEHVKDIFPGGILYNSSKSVQSFPVNLNATQTIFGYDVISIDKPNSKDQNSTTH